MAFMPISNPPMATYREIQRILLVLSVLIHLVSTDGYSCNCDCGPNAGGGRCSLQLPAVQYLKSGGSCQAIRLEHQKQQCVKNLDTEHETVCWGMPRTACMCREPVGSYNLMCECDGNRGIFCGSEQNNCICEVLQADGNIALTIGIAVGASIVGIFILTFIATAIYFIRQAQKESDPWYQFDKQFKKFIAKKERDQVAALRRPPPKTKARPPASTLSSSSVMVTSGDATTCDLTKQPTPHSANELRTSTTHPSRSSPSISLAKDGSSMDTRHSQNLGTNPSNRCNNDIEPPTRSYNSRIQSPALSTRNPSHLYCSTLKQSSGISGGYNTKESSSLSSTSAPNNPARMPDCYDNGIYDVID